MPTVESNTPRSVISELGNIRQALGRLTPSTNTPTAQLESATLLVLNTSYPGESGPQLHPRLSIGCIGLGATPSVTRGGFVVPCLTKPLEFDIAAPRNEMPYAEPAEITLEEKEALQWRSWEVGAAAVEQHLLDILDDQERRLVKRELTVVSRILLPRFAQFALEAGSRYNLT